jgi:trigger factor
MTDEASKEEQAKSGESAGTENQPVIEEAEGQPVVEEAVGTMTEEPPEDEEDAPLVLHQAVEMKDIGPCKKHIKVTIERDDIDKLMEKKFKKLVGDAPVPGFRPGKAPRRIIEKRYQKEVSNEVRGEVLMQSLEQLAEEHELVPLTSPNLNPDRLEIPKDGPFIYEFEVEVRPEIELPDYKGLKLKRPVKTFTEADVDVEERRILSRYGQMVPKPEGSAEIGDYLVADMVTRDGQNVIGSTKETTVLIEPQLAFKDGVAPRFGEQVVGAKAGDWRTVEIRLSNRAAAKELHGKTVHATFEIKEIKTLRLPELTDEFLHRFGVHTREQLREKIHVTLGYRLEYQQRQSARQQILQLLTAGHKWELPNDIVQRQARSALNKRIVEMRSAGMSDDEIRGQIRLLEQDVLQSTTSTLSEHFVLQKVAETEKLDISEDDIDIEIERIAAMENESPRRVRARFEREDLLESLATEIVERKALDLILQNAEYEDVPLDAGPGAVATVEQQAVPGQMQDPTAPPPEPEVSQPATPEQPVEAKSEGTSNV